MNWLTANLVAKPSPKKCLQCEHYEQWKQICEFEECSRFRVTLYVFNETKIVTEGIFDTVHPCTLNI